MHENMDASFKHSQNYRYKHQPSLYYTNLGRISLEPSCFSRYQYFAAYRSRLSTEWTPTTRAKHMPPTSNQTPPIYLTSVGLMPHYGGYIPGSKYRFGQTYGTDSRDVKLWMRMPKAQ